jgi:hypothetical protein
MALQPLDIYLFKGLCNQNMKSKMKGKTMVEADGMVGCTEKLPPMILLKYLYG